MEQITCPICGAVITRKADFCPNCGSVLQERPAPAEEGSKGFSPEIKVDDFIDIWKNNSPKDARTMKGLHIATTVLSSFAGFLSAFTVLSLVFPSLVDIFPSFLSDYRVFLIALGALGLLTSVTVILNKLKKRWTGLRCSQWLLQNNVDIKEFLLRNRESGKRLGKDHLTVAHYYFHPNRRGNHVAVSVICIILASVDGFFSMLITMGLIAIFFTQRYPSIFSFPWGALLAFEIIGFIVFAICGILEAAIGGIHSIVVT